MCFTCDVLYFHVLFFHNVSVDSRFSQKSLLTAIEKFIFFSPHVFRLLCWPPCTPPSPSPSREAALGSSSPGTVTWYWLFLSVCFCSHAKLRCMCSCNRCTYCICHNLLNSELVRSVKAKFYRSLSIALYIPHSPSPLGDLSNIFLTHHLSSLLAVGLTGLRCISTERCWEMFWLYVKMITSVLF